MTVNKEVKNSEVGVFMRGNRVKANGSRVESFWLHFFSQCMLCHNMVPYICI